MEIPWEALFAFLLEAIEKCKSENESDDAIKSRIRNPRGLQLLRAGWRVRKELGMSRREYRQHAPEILQQIKTEAAELTDADLNELIADATCCDE